MYTSRSIRGRLQRLVALTTSITLGTACTLFVLFEWRNSLATEERSARTAARIAADASSGMLAFDSQTEAEKLVKSFDEEPEIRAVVLYDNTGQPFAQYREPDFPMLPPVAPELGLQIVARRLAITVAVVYEGKRFGTLFLQVDLTPMYERLWRYVWTALTVFVAALLAAFLIGAILQRTIARPLLSLAETARVVSRDHNYGVRANPGSLAELDVLTTAFNQMLHTIESQQVQLRSELDEKTRAQKAEAKEKQLLATTLASIGDGVIVTDPGGRVVTLNGEAERLTGWGSVEAVGRPLPEIFKIINEDTRVRVENPVEKVLRLGTIVGLANHTLLIRKDGAEIPIDDSAAPIREAGGPLSGVVLIFRDFSEQKKAESALRENEARERARALEFQTIMESVPAVIFISRDPDCRVITGNRASHELLRLPWGTNPSLSAVPGERPTHFEVRANGRTLQPEELPVQRASRGEEVLNYEEEVHFADGSSKWLLGNAIPLRDPHGRIYGAVAAFVDISERKVTERQLQESEARFRAMADTIAPLAWMANADGWIFFYNRRWYDYTGTALAEMEGWGWEKVLHPEHLQRVTDKWRSHLEQGREWEDTFPLRGVDGQYRWFLSRAFPLRDADGRISRWFGTNTDVTELRDAQQELERLNGLLDDRGRSLEALVDKRTAELRETVGQLEEFSYSLAHDLRAPLRAMQSFANLLGEEMGETVSGAGRDYIRRIITAAERMDHLIRDVLDYSRVARDELPLGAVNLGELIRGIVDTYPLFQPPHAQIKIEGSFPVVRANAAALTQCVSNLLGNATKFVLPGTTPNIRVWSESKSGRVRLFIHDNGIGIKSEARDKIFEMFQRLSNRYEGTGIGLTIVKKAVERMGGEVDFESVPGRGSTFWLELIATNP